MKITLYIDPNCLLDSEQAELLRETFSSACQQWLTESRSSAELIDNEEALGLSIDTNRKKTLSKPLDFLYLQAQQQELEFVVGLVNDRGEHEEVCYFGLEEGKPDLFEVANYLGLEK